MNDNNSDVKAGLFAGLINTTFVVGLLAGVIAGLLLAPQSGRETREMIKERVSAIREGIMRGNAGHGMEQERHSG